MSDLVVTTRHDRSVVLPPWPVQSSSTSKFIIYALIDPRFNTVRYIGKSCAGLNRPRYHTVLAARRDPRYELRRCYNWIRQLLVLRLRYDVVVLEETNVAVDLATLERWWIAFARAWGCPLTNLTDGGDGVHGLVCSQETRAKLRAMWENPSIRARIYAAREEPSAKERHRVAICEAVARPAIKARHRAALARPEVKVRHRAGILAAWVRPETKVRQSAGYVRIGLITSMTYRHLLTEYPTETDEQIYVRAVAELGVERAGKKCYPAWYRGQLRRRALAVSKKLLTETQQSLT